MTRYRTIEGDMIDDICHRHYGDEGMVEQVYEANPRLAALGPVLPKGITIVLPEIETAAPRSTIRLWGHT